MEKRSDHGATRFLGHSPSISKHVHLKLTKNYVSTQRCALLRPRSARTEMPRIDRALFEHVNKDFCINITMQADAKLLQRDIVEDFAQNTTHAAESFGKGKRP